MFSLVLYVFCVSMVLGTVPEALLMPSVAGSVRSAGSGVQAFEYVLCKYYE